MRLDVEVKLRRIRHALGEIPSLHLGCAAYAEAMGPAEKCRLRTSPHNEPIGNSVDSRRAVVRATVTGRTTEGYCPKKRSVTDNVDDQRQQGPTKRTTDDAK